MRLCSSLATTTIARIVRVLFSYISARLQHCPSCLVRRSNARAPRIRTARLTIPFKCARLALAPFDPHVGERDDSLAPHATPLSPITCSTPVPRRARLQPAPRHPRTSAVSPPLPVSPSQHSAVYHRYRAPTLPLLPPAHARTSSHPGCDSHFPPLLPCPWATRLAHVIILPICELAPPRWPGAIRLAPHQLP
ncbi:hypothetical protein B0H14DRAFT_3616961 [Mycena olivaceomarginata]|nr:hypothetical protein B0H14DRAFT_3616961 [Mycena olivaceomarginata]